MVFVLFYDRSWVRSASVSELLRVRPCPAQGLTWWLSSWELTAQRPVSAGHPPPAEGRLELGEWTTETSGLGRMGESGPGGCGLLQGLGAWPAPGGHLATPRDIYVCRTGGGVLRASRGWRPGFWQPPGSAGMAPNTGVSSAKCPRGSESLASAEIRKMNGANQVKKEASILAKGAACTKVLWSGECG